MRINGYFDSPPLAGAYIVATVILKDHDIQENVEFLVDTGSPKTIIMDADVFTLDVDYSKLSKNPVPRVGFGGSVDTYIASGARLVFTASDEQEHAEHIDVEVVKHSRLSQDVLRLPSILGRDILNKYSLFYRRKSGSLIVTDEVSKL